MEIEKRYVGISEEEGEDFDLSVYEDECCREKVMNIDFGPVKPGEEKIKWYWIKNTGEAYLPEVYVGMGIIGEEGWETRDDSTIEGSLDVGEKRMVAFRLKVEAEVRPGKYSGSIPITVYGEESSI